MTKDQKRKMNKALELSQKIINLNCEVLKIASPFGLSLATALACRIQSEARLIPHTIYKADGKGIDKRRARRYWRKHMKPSTGDVLLSVNMSAGKHHDSMASSDGGA